MLLPLSGAALADNWVPLLRSGNETELERRGAAAGAMGVAAELRSEDRKQVLAALIAARGADDSWALLGVLAQSATHPDRPIAILAAQLGAELSHEIDLQMISEQEIPSEYLRQWQGAWLEVATQPSRWIDIRIYALEVASTLTRLISDPARQPLDWEQFFSDPDQEMRAAALELAPQSQDLVTRAADFLKTEEHPRVALSAGLRLCGPIGSHRSSSLPTIDDTTQARLQALATNKSLAIEARIDLAPCLVANPSTASRDALSALQRQSTPYLRKLLLAVGKTPAP